MGLLGPPPGDAAGPCSFPSNTLLQAQAVPALCGGVTGCPPGRWGRRSLSGGKTVWPFKKLARWSKGLGPGSLQTNAAA